MSRRAAVLGVCLLLLAGCREVVLTARPEAEANLALETLYAAGLQPAKQAAARGRFDVTVPSDAVGRAVAALRGVGLPRERGPGLSEFLAEPGLVPSEFEEVARYHQALSGDIEASLVELPDIRDARVHLAVAPPTGSRRPATTDRVQSASVLLFRAAVAGGPETALEEVRSLVSGAVAGLDPSAVSVIEATLPPPPLSPGAPATSSPPRALAAAAVSVFAGLGLTVAALARRRRRASDPDPEPAEG